MVSWNSGLCAGIRVDHVLGTGYIFRTKAEFQPAEGRQFRAGAGHTLTTPPLRSNLYSTNYHGV